MNDRDFKELCKSIKQAGKLMRGKMQPSRTFDVQPTKLSNGKQGKQKECTKQ